MIDFKNAEYLKLAPIDAAAAQEKLAPLLIPDEHVVAAFKAIRDSIIFTDKRIIAVNVQGITGKKTDYTSLPYTKIKSFSVETAGTFDLDSELTLWFSGLGLVRFEFTRGVDITQLNAIIARAVL